MVLVPFRHPGSGDTGVPGASGSAQSLSALPAPPLPPPPDPGSSETLLPPVAASLEADLGLHFDDIPSHTAGGILDDLEEEDVGSGCLADKMRAMEEAADEFEVSSSGSSSDGEGRGLKSGGRASSSAGPSVSGGSVPPRPPSDAAGGDEAGRVLEMPKKENEPWPRFECPKFRCHFVLDEGSGSVGLHCHRHGCRFNKVSSKRPSGYLLWRCCRRPTRCQTAQVINRCTWR